MDAVSGYESKKYKDTKLQEKALKYINCLKDSMEHVNYFVSDNVDEIEKWEEIVEEREMLVKDFVENYGLSVSKKYQDTLDEFVANGKTAEQKQEKEEIVNKSWVSCTQLNPRTGRGYICDKTNI